MTMRFQEESQERGEAAQRVCRAVKVVRELVLAGLKGGYEEHCLIPPHFAENLREEQDGWEGVADFSCPE